MQITVFRNMTINSLADAKEFAKEFHGEYYVAGDKVDICLETFKGEFTLSTRPVSARGNVFFPYCAVDDPIKGLYKYRKYINRMIRQDE